MAARQHNNPEREAVSMSGGGLVRRLGRRSDLDARENRACPPRGWSPRVCRVERYPAHGLRQHRPGS